MVERLEVTLATIGGLERFRGHLYNWYDTRDLHTLEPAYVSSVDSGNLAGHLLTLSNACRQMIDQPLPVAAALAGIGDAIALTREAAGAIGDDRRSQTLSRRHLEEALELPVRIGVDVPETPEAWVGPPRRARRPTSRTLSDVAAALTADARRTLGWRARRPGPRRRGSPSSSHRSRPRAARPPSCRRGVPDDRRTVPIRPTARPATAAPAAATLVRRLAAIADRAQRALRGDGLQVPVRPDPQALLDRLPRHGTARSIRATTTCSRPRPG